MSSLKTKIFIRADGNSQIGLGHLVRCSALADMLKDFFEIIFYCREIPNTIFADLSSNGIICEKIENENEFFNQLTGSTIVVLDGYHFDTNYQKRIKAKDCKLVCIDDLHDKEFVADLIINHSPGIKPSDYKASNYTQYALGLEYILVRKAFLEYSQEQRIVKDIQTVMICFGSSDPLNLTKSVLQVVMKFEKFKKIIVITGAANQNINVLSELIEKDERIEHRHSLNQQQMLQTMLQTDLAIVPTSGILFELMAVGVAAITGYFTKNQQEASLNLSSLHLAFNLGNLLDNLNEKLYNQIGVITVDLAQKLVDKQKYTIENSKKFYIKIFRQLQLRN